MTDSPSDFYRDRATIDRLKAIAAGIFARHGIDFAAARRAGGWSNATWLAGGLALRLAVEVGNENISREVGLAAILPAEVGYPPVVKSGVTDGYAWSLSKEMPGRNLGAVWAELNWEGRADALCQLWQKMLAVHRVDAAAAGDLARNRAWYNSNDPAEAAASLSALVQQAVLSSPQADALRASLDRFWLALPAASCVLNHGDLTIENALWDAGRVVSLLDFEYAVSAPAELDANQLLKYAFAPAESDDNLPDPNGRGRARLRQVMADLAAPLIAHPGGPDLLLGYAILLELWKLEGGLAHPEGEGPLAEWQCYRGLHSLADGRGGYLAPIF